MKKGSLSNSSSDYGLDESYNSADEATDSAFSQACEFNPKLNSTTTINLRPTTLNTNPQYTQAQYSAQQMQHNVQNSQYIIQYTQVQKSSQYSSKQSSNVVYSKIQKEGGSIQQPSPDPWGENTNRSTNLTTGPPPSLAEQLKQVS